MAQKMTTFSVAAENAAAAAIGALLNGGSVRLYSGLRPVPPSLAVTNLNPAPLLLATLTLPNPAFAAASNGAVLANAVTGVAAVAEGHADWFQALDSSSNPVMTGSCSSDSTGNLTLNAEELTIGQTVNITFWRLAGASVSWD